MAGPDPHPPWLDALLARESFGIKLGLATIDALCEALGRPERACPCVHVAGTNGKGSVSAMVSAALGAAGHRTARYTSPHLVRLDERFVVDGAPLPPEVLAAAAGRVFAAEAALRAERRLAGPATFFELTTALAVEAFRAAGAGVAVYEVGLGGRFDATNVVQPEACAITTIAMDHTAQLGSSLEAIASEKAGIVKPGVPVVCGERAAGPRGVIARAAAAAGSPFLDAFDGIEAHADLEPDGRLRLRLRTPAADYGTVHLALRGRHQADNAVVAVRLLEALDARGVRAGRDAIVAGLETARWPGRLQVVPLRGGGTVLLDAAHNPAGALTLAAYLRESFPPRPPLVFAAMRDKDVGGMLAALAPAIGRLVCTQPATPRARPAEDLAREADALLPGVTIEVAGSPGAALDRALAAAPAVVVAGSIFLVGEVLDLVAARAAGPVW